MTRNIRVKYIVNVYLMAKTQQGDCAEQDNSKEERSSRPANTIPDYGLLNFTTEGFNITSRCYWYILMFVTINYL